jgi:hypothetical protein
MTDHVCEYPEVLIEEPDEAGILKMGMKVLAPCRTCGGTPLEHVEFLEARDAELSNALLAIEPHRALYHWSPRARRKQIERYGLRPYMRPSTTTTGDRRIPYVCLGDTPSWAWALSGGMPWSPGGEWDLWMVWLNQIISPLVLATPDRPSGLYEVRTEHRIYKRHLWYVGSRSK